MEARLLLAFVLMGLVLFGTQYFYKPRAAAEQSGRDGREKFRTGREWRVESLGRSQANSDETGLGCSGRHAGPGAIRQRRDRDRRYGSLSRGVFESRRGGAELDSQSLQGSQGPAARSGELSGARKGAACRCRSRSRVRRRPQIRMPDLFRVDQSPDNLRVAFEFSDGQANTKKTFQFAKDSYLVAGHLPGEPERTAGPALAPMARRIR